MSAMKKVFLLISLLVFLGILVAVGAVVYSKFYSHTISHSADAREFVQQLVPKVVETWDVQALRDHSTPEFNRVVSPENMERLFQDLKKLGAVKQLDEPRGGVKDSLDGTIVGTFKVDSEFENDKAIIEVQVFYLEDEWRVNGFRVQQENLKL